jgi:menaquinone-dependent protoporphyrinogen IX oxidase
MKTLIAYASKGKTTYEYAHVISKVLSEKGIEADLSDLRKTTPNTEPYDVIIVGTGVRAGRMYSEAVKFLQNDLSDKKVAFFVSTLEPESDARRKYVESLKIRLFSTAVFGGKFKILWKNIDKTDKSKARRWAEQLFSNDKSVTA